jgi:hypothetical protein
MATSNRIGGTMALSYDGNTLEARGNFTVTGPTVKRDGVAGLDGVHGYVEVPIVPSIKGDVSIGNQLSIVTLEQITNATVLVALANGMSYMLSDAWVTSAFSIDAHEGKVGIEFQGMTMQELITQ